MNNFFNNFLTKDEQKILLFIIFFGFLGFILKFSNISAQNQTEAPDSLQLAKDYEIKYDLLSVTQGELETISGIGPKTAKSILSFREKQGFQNKIDLMKVKGIGPKTYQKIEKYFLDFGETAIEVSKTNNKKRVKAKSESHDQIKININTADAKEFQKLKGIGPAKAEKIIQFREKNGAFQTIDDLQKVKGIGPKTLEKLRKFLTLGENNDQTS